MTATRDAFEAFKAKYGGGFLNDDATNDNDKLLQTLARDVWQAATLAAKRQPLTHEQRLDLHMAFEPHKCKWDAQSILIDMIEAAHGIKA